MLSDWSVWNHSVLFMILFCFLSYPLIGDMELHLYFLQIKQAYQPLAGEWVRSDLSSVCNFVRSSKTCQIWIIIFLPYRQRSGWRLGARAWATATSWWGQEDQPPPSLSSSIPPSSKPPADQSASSRMVSSSNQWIRIRAQHFANSDPDPSYVDSNNF